MKKEKTRTYADIVTELELVISKLNSSDIPIEKSLKLYEEGVKLTNEADKELLTVEKNINSFKKSKKNNYNEINIEKSFDKIESIIESLTDEDISINDAEYYYKEALDIIFNIESYLKKAKSKIKKYEQ
jgi:exodeoxyribonuclease VII small subunit